MFTIVFILASGAKFFVTLPDIHAYDDQDRCKHVATEFANHINNDVHIKDKVKIIRCLRNA